MQRLILFLCFLCSTIQLSAVGIQDLTITSVSYESIPLTAFTTPGFPQGGDPLAISNSGVVSGDYGYSLYGNYFEGDFTYGNGIVNTFAGPTVSTYVLPTGINDSGVIILSSPQSAVGFVGIPGAFTPVAFPGATQTTLSAINDGGVVVGSYVDANGNSHGFIYKPNGTYTSFDSQITGIFGGGTQLIGINNQGNIVGVSGGQPFIYINGRFDFLPELPTSISDRDQIFFPLGYGGSDILDYNTNTLEVLSGGYAGIDRYFSKMNNSGIITGGFRDSLVVPTPEPATFVLVLPVLAGLAFYAKKRTSSSV